MVEFPEESVANATPPHARGKRNCLIFLLVWAVVSGSIYAIVDVEWPDMGRSFAGVFHGRPPLNHAKSVPVPLNDLANPD